MINIVIPMAGRGSRFASVGYEKPKPLIEVHGKPMIELVINNLIPSQAHRFIFLCLDEHIEKFEIDQKLKNIAPGSLIVCVKAVTEGAACTVLLAEEFINSPAPLMIANSDQWIDFDVNKYLSSIASKNLDGLIMTMRANDPKWSYARLNSNGLVTEVIEKVVVSDEATTGIYNFAHGEDFVSAARAMITQNLRVNGEFYVAPTYNQLIADGKLIGVYNVGSVENGMYGLGTPDDLNKFLTLEISRKAAGL